jgi:hypothetical protein
VAHSETSGGWLEIRTRDPEPVDVHDGVGRWTSVEAVSVKQGYAVDENPTGGQRGDRSSSHGFTIKHRHWTESSSSGDVQEVSAMTNAGIANPRRLECPRLSTRGFLAGHDHNRTPTTATPIQGDAMLAYDYPILGVFWTMFIFFLWFAWLMLLFKVFIDIFRSEDLGGFSKAIWTIAVIILPFLGVFIYVIARGKSMGDRDIAQAKANDAAFRSYVQDAASSSASVSDELTRLADLNAKGVLTDAEFAQQKAKLLS